MLVFVHFDDSKWEALDELVVDENINRVNSGAWEGETLEANDEVAGHEGDIVRHLDRHGTFNGHLFVDGLAIFINNRDLEFMIAVVLGSEAKAHGERALRVHDRGGFGGEGVESTGDDHLALIFGGEIAKSCYL